MNISQNSPPMPMPLSKFFTKPQDVAEYFITTGDVIGKLKYLVTILEGETLVEAQEMLEEMIRYKGNFTFAATSIVDGVLHIKLTYSVVGRLFARTKETIYGIKNRPLSCSRVKPNETMEHYCKRCTKNRELSARLYYHNRQECFQEVWRLYKEFYKSKRKPRYGW